MSSISTQLRNVTLAVFTLLITSTLQAQFTFDGEIRPRFEYRNGFQSVINTDQNHAAFVEQRSRLNFGYKAEGYRVKITLQDIQIWGSQPQLVNTYNKVNGDGAYLSFHEAWGEAFLSDSWSLKFGRQEISLDDHRIFGNVGWASQARSHDAAIFKYKKNKLKLDAGFAYNQDRAANLGTDAFRGGYKAFQYLWMHNDFSDNFGVSFLFLNNGREQMVFDANTGTTSYKDIYSQTTGTRITYKKDKLKANVNFYKQTGLQGIRTAVPNDSNGDFDRKVSATNLGIDIAYSISKSLTGTIGYEYLSGNSQTSIDESYNRTNRAFNPLYGTNHKFNGLMDYFYVGNHNGSVGLSDIFAKVKYKTEKYWIGTDVHFFSAPEDVWDGFNYNKDLADGSLGTKTRADYAMDSYLGTEIDVTFGFNLAKGVSLKGGYSVMLDTETLAYLKGALDANGQGVTSQNNAWGWTMITIKPNFLEKKGK